MGWKNVPKDVRREFVFRMTFLAIMFGSLFVYVLAG